MRGAASFQHQSSRGECRMLTSTMSSKGHDLNYNWQSPREVEPPENSNSSTQHQHHGQHLLASLDDGTCLCAGDRLVSGAVLGGTPITPGTARCEGKVAHYCIMCHAHKLSVSKEVYFENLMQLVEHYISDKDGLCICLMKPKVVEQQSASSG
ncbi:hypothetical protein CB1_000210006 [Camelus ferus]|nr:hypothetical protein CB1_000210006 [Camelus ferus]